MAHYGAFTVKCSYVFQPETTSKGLASTEEPTTRELSLLNMHVFICFIENMNCSIIELSINLETHSSDGSTLHSVQEGAGSGSMPTCAWHSKNELSPVC